MNGKNVLAFDSTLKWDINRTEGASMLSGGLWFTSLQSSIRKTAKLGAVIGRGSGKAYQLALPGKGIVVVQASEGHPVPTAQ